MLVSLSLSSGHLVPSLLPWVGLLTVYISLEMKGVTLCLPAHHTLVSSALRALSLRLFVFDLIGAGSSVLICLFFTMSLFSGRPAGPYICICFVGRTRVLDPLAHVHSLKCDSESHTRRHIFFTWTGTYQRGRIDMLERV